MPNHAVLEELGKCDFVIDQAFADYGMAGFATEAAWFGKTAVVGGYQSELWQSWLTDQDNRSGTRQQVYDHWEAETGLELTRFFDAWITGRTTPPEGLLGA